MDHKKSWKLFCCGFIAGVVLGVIGKFTKNLWLLIPALILMVAAILQQIIFYRCPNCGRNLPTRGGAVGPAAQYCPYCGHDLGWEE